ncbi:MAG: hypothetical protein R3B72_14860 [Polyangiaceae bacterium]
MRQALVAGAVALAIAGACGRSTPPGGSGGGGAGMGGCPQVGAEPLYTLVITTESAGPLPVDASLAVKWSAGEEPLFVLADDTTWHSLEDGSNLVCDVTAPLPEEVFELRCGLWTQGATEIEVTGTGYLPHLETLMPQTQEGCEEPIASEVAVVLVEEEAMPGR